MTVKELIAKLSEFDGDTRVLVDFQGELADIKTTNIVVATPLSDAGFYREEDFVSVEGFLAASWVDDEDKIGAFQAVEVGR